MELPLQDRQRRDDHRLLERERDPGDEQDGERDVVVLPGGGRMNHRGSIPVALGHEHGRLVGGVDGAEPGILLPGEPDVGHRYGSSFVSRP